MKFLNEKEYQNLDQQTLKSLNYSIIDGISWSVMFALTSGVFLIGFALFLGATPFQIGLISSLPFLANAAQIIGAYFVESTGQKKKISITTALVNRFLWIPIILTPFLIFPYSKAIWIVIILFSLSSIFGAISGVAWLSWTSTIVPKNILGKFFSKRNAYIGFVTVIIGLLGGLFLDYWGINQLNLLHAFAVIFSIAVVFGLLSVFYQRLIQEIPVKAEHVTFKKFVGLVRMPYKDENFRKFVRFGLIWGFALGIVGPFFIVYQLDILELNYMMIVALNTLFIVSGIISLSKWGDVVDRYGAKPVLAISSFIVSLYPLFFLFVTKQNFMLLVPINILAGIAWSGVDFASAQILLRISPYYNKSVYFSSFAAASGIALGIAPILGGFLVGIFESISLPLVFITLSGIHIIFLLSGILRLWSTSFIPSINEPEAGNVDEVLSALKSSRLMNIFVNFYHISQFSIGVFTLPLIYSRKIYSESEKIFRKEFERFRVNSLKTLKELEKITKASILELRKVKYKDAKKLLPQLIILNKQVKTLKDRVLVAEDEKAIKLFASNIVKIEQQASTMLQKLKITKEITKVPEYYVRKIIKLVRKVKQ